MSVKLVGLLLVPFHDARNPNSAEVLGAMVPLKPASFTVTAAPLCV